MISAIVCAFNEEDTIANVLKVLTSHEKISRVIVVDDGSTDKTNEIVSTTFPQVTLVKNKVNSGKGAAFVKGFRNSGNETILTIDADLKNLQSDHISLLINTYRNNNYKMVIGRRSPLTLKTWFLGANFSGDRIFSAEAVRPWLGEIEKSGYGLEVILNCIHTSHQIGAVVLEGLVHPLRYEKDSLVRALFSYTSQLFQVIRAYLFIKWHLLFKTKNK